MLSVDDLLINLLDTLPLLSNLGRSLCHCAEYETPCSELAILVTLCSPLATLCPLWPLSATPCYSVLTVYHSILYVCVVCCSPAGDEYLFCMYAWTVCYSLPTFCHSVPLSLTLTLPHSSPQVGHPLLLCATLSTLPIYRVIPAPYLIHRTMDSRLEPSHPSLQISLDHSSKLQSLEHYSPRRKHSCIRID